jgi:hypothetical protein
MKNNQNTQITKQSTRRKCKLFFAFPAPKVYSLSYSFNYLSQHPTCAYTSGTQPDPGPEFQQLISQFP